MKKITMFLFALLTVSVSFVSCNDDDNNTTNEDQGVLEGKWYYSEEGVGTSDWNTVQYAAYSHMSGCEKDYIDFAEGGVYRDVMHVENCDTETYTTVWSRTGDTVIIDTDGDAVMEDINFLNSNVLRTRQLVSGSGSSAVYAYTLYTRQ